MKRLKIIIPAIALFIVLGCSTGSRMYVGSSYKFLEHGANEVHSPGELREECRRTRAEINKLKLKIKRERGPGSAGIIAQAARDIKYLDGKFQEAGCEEVLSRPPQAPEENDMKHTHAPAAVKAGHTAETHAGSGHGHGAVQPEGKKETLSRPLTFDECFQKCRELTDRTNEQCFDTCLGR